MAHPFAPRLAPGDLGLEAWSLIASSAEGPLLVQHALALGPRRQRAAVRALVLRGGRADMREAPATRATVDANRERALWDGHSLSVDETYGRAGGWRWRLRAGGDARALAPPLWLAALSDVWLSAPRSRLELGGEIDLGEGWTPLGGPACLLHRASLEGAGPWAWLALPDRGLVVAQWRLPGLPLGVAMGCEDAPWPLAWGPRLRRTDARWRLERPARPALELVERGRLVVDKGLSARVTLAWVEAVGTGEQGVLEYLEPCR